MARWLASMVVGLGMSSAALADVAPGGDCRCATGSGDPAWGALWVLAVVGIVVVTMRTGGTAAPR